MDKKLTPTASLRGAHFQDVAGGKIAWGYIWDDSKGRFRDGTYIHTSLITHHDEEAGIIRTLNSTYQIILE